MNSILLSIAYFYSESAKSKNMTIFQNMETNLCNEAFFLHPLI